MINNLQDTVKLNNGVDIPWVGLGVFKVQDGNEVVNSVKTAIKNGYRSIEIQQLLIEMKKVLAKESKKDLRKMVFQEKIYL